MPPVVAISMGDPSGVGPEVLARALASARVRRALVPRLYGDAGVLARAARAAGVRPPEGVIEVTRLAARAARPGEPSAEGARAQAAYLEAAIGACRAGEASALCTAPIAKAQLHRAGLPYPGHTELLAERFGSPQVALMMAGPRLRVVLATTHLALRDVSARLTRAGLAGTLLLAHQELFRLFGVRAPRLAVCGLNPHAGEGGAFGDEEARVIRPAMEDARRRGARVEGPFSADALFPRALATGRWDAVVAMYHDQGLVAAKLADLARTVNVTLGLPVPRTSPDHGVAYDIAGKGVADATSMEEALLLAARLAGRPRRAGRPRPRSGARASRSTGAGDRARATRAAPAPPRPSR